MEAESEGSRVHYTPRRTSIKMKFKIFSWVVYKQNKRNNSQGGYSSLIFQASLGASRLGLKSGLGV